MSRHGVRGSLRCQLRGISSGVSRYEATLSTLHLQYVNLLKVACLWFNGLDRWAIGSCVRTSILGEESHTLHWNISASSPRLQIP